MMSASGVVTTRVVAPPVAARNSPSVQPAPNSTSLAKVVVTAPLLAAFEVPDADEVTSTGSAGSTPLYSAARRSTNGVAPENVTVTVLALAALATMFLAYQMVWLRATPVATGAAWW